MNYLLTAAEVISIAFNDKNYLSGKILSSHLEIAHEALLRPALGDDFYAELTDTVLTAGVNKTFADTYLKGPLAWYVRYLILPEIYVHVSNTGLLMAQTEGTATASDKQAGLVRDQAKANADILMRKALFYLEENIDDFPTFSSNETVNDNTKVIGGIIF
jgi:hypothetical protein